MTTSMGRGASLRCTDDGEYAFRILSKSRLPRPKERSSTSVKSCAGADGSSRTKSLSFLIHPSPSGCDEGDDVPVDSQMNRNIDTSTRHGLRRQFLAHCILLVSRSAVVVFDAIFPWAFP
jgi:hypothetical protein